MKKTLGILGGMGPLATADLFRKIILMTEASCDQDHIRVIIDSNSEIPDRTAFLKDGGESPAPYLIKSAKFLEEAGADCIIMPCNTAHYFYNKIIKEIKISFLNMLDETAKELRSSYINAKCVGLLATPGTAETKIYNKAFSKYDIDVVRPDDEHQQYITELIYNIKKGIYNFDLSKFYKSLDYLKSLKAELFILGCTEIPIAFEHFKIQENTVNPTTVIAQSAIKFLGYKLKN
ncbi:MAG: amino acid racemase [Victivallales bacterium]|nr:amino acid racemase [Victivallales bacterium]MCF7888963.1 amino acid racemase [Victivallales bacterium]